MTAAEHVWSVSRDVNGLWVFLCACGERSKHRWHTEESATIDGMDHSVVGRGSLRDELNALRARAEVESGDVVRLRRIEAAARALFVDGSDESWGELGEALGFTQ